MAARASEIKGISELLLSDYETPEEAAKTIITWLDKSRMDRTSYVAVMQFGERVGNIFYAGCGPYPGIKSATKAVLGHPAAGEASKLVVVPVTSPEGLAEKLRNLDTYSART